MLNKLIILIALVSLNVVLLPGQTIHYDYDNSGNRLIRYIILQKSISTVGILEDKIVTKPFQGLTENSKMADFEEKLEEMTIKIFPNPTKGQLAIVISGIGQDETADYQLFSQAGLLVDTKRGNGNEFTVDMKRCPSGLYILRLMIRGKISQWKILKE